MRTSVNLFPHLRRLAFRSIASLLVASTPLAAQGGPPPTVRAAVRAIEGMIESSGDASLQEFATASLAPSYRLSFGGDSLLRHLRGIRTAVGTIGGVLLNRDSAGFLLLVEGAHNSTVRFTLDSAGKITLLKLAPTSAGQSAAPPSAWAGVTWDNLQEKIDRAAANGFYGTILARRNGSEVARSAMGLSDSVSGRRTALNTVYCIGSQPMDFTITAVMLLGQRGKLALDDTITKFFDNVPVDKRGITVRQLLTGRSGLVDFFHIDEVDWNADLAWIPKEEAVRRMMASKLRFAPGTARQPSHAAFVMLAAVIEKVSGKTYQDFLRQELLQPLHMTRTGFYGETLGLPLSDFAVGSGPSFVGLPNIPPNWGPTSWLVMGSGGMISTLDDMDRYYVAIANGTLLTGEWARFQQGRRAGSGGSERGYFIHHVTDGAGTSVLFLTNTPGRQRVAGAMQAFEQLVLGTVRQ